MRRWISWIHWLAIGTAIATSSGCAQLSPDQDKGSTQSAVLAKQQDNRSAELAAEAPGRRVWLAGFAMSSTSTAFQGDLELVSRRLSELGGPVLKYEHSNEPQTDHLRYPFATPLTARQTIRHIADRARDDDIVVVFISTHGSRKVLSVNAAQTELDGLTSAALAEALAPLGDRPTVVILAACFSGSFVPDLRRENRIVLTAAAAERTSYGCEARGRNTFFVEELLKNNFNPDESISQAMARVRSQTIQRENLLHFTHSEPQIYASPKLLWLLERPLKNWFEPGNTLVGPLAGLDDAGKLGYTRYISQSYPSAFAVGAHGHWSAAWTSANALSSDAPVARALDSCNRRSGENCRLYSVDGRVLPSSESTNSLK